MRVTIRDVKVICCAPQKINLVTVKVETSEPGLYGVGCATFAHRHLAVVAAVEKYLKPYLIGRDVSDIEDIWQSIKGMSYWRNGPVLIMPCQVWIWHYGILKAKWPVCPCMTYWVENAEPECHAIRMLKAPQ